MVTLELSHGLLDGFFLLTLLLLISLTEESNPEDLGTSGRSSVSAGTSETCSSFFMKSVNIWNLSSSDILLGVASSEL